MRQVNILTDTKVKSFKEPCRFSDGAGLYLYVSKTLSKSWVYRWKTSGKRREMGLGPYPTISLSKARKLAQQAREAVAEGRDPIAEKKLEAEPTFEECVIQFLQTMESQWSNAKHKQQWKMTLTRYCVSISKIRVSKIGTAEVLRVLKPIWQEKPETASRTRGRIEKVLDYAKGRGWRDGENPAVWRGNLKAMLPSPQKRNKHHEAIPYKEMPSFLFNLRSKPSISASALEFLILTASRTGETIGAKLSEIDEDNKVWTVPAERMKAGLEHRVPLTDRAFELSQLYRDESEYIFPGGRIGKPLSNMAMANLLKTHKRTETVHGMRSAFRDWAGDETTFPRELAEQALAHKIGDAAEQAYRRSDALERRRELMNAWERYIYKVETKVIQLGQSKHA